MKRRFSGFVMPAPAVWLAAAALASAVAACDQGLAPSAAAPAALNGSFSGKVRFVHWDSAGTVYDLRLVAFRVYPPPNIVQEVLQGRAAVYPPLGGPALADTGTDSVRYVINLTPGTYAYVVVAQQFGADVMADWRAVGLFSADTSHIVPAPVVVAAGDTARGIDIDVDFRHLPPPPFR